MKNRKLLLIVSLVLALTMAIGGTLAYLTDTDEAVNVMTLGNVDIEQIELQRKEGIKHNATLAEDDLEPFEQGQALYPAFPVHNDPNDYEAAGNEADSLKWGPYVTADVAEGGTAWNGLFNEENLVGAMDKFVFVENTGDSPCYYRTWLAFECPEGLVFSTQGVNEDNKPDLWINTNGNDRFVWEWEDDEFVTIDGVRYLLMCATYQKELPAGEISRPSLLQVALTHHADNADMAALGETYEILAFSQAVQTANMPNANAALTAAFGAPTKENHPWKDADGNDYVPGLPTTTVKTAEELKAALAEGGIVVLTDDIDLEDKQMVLPANAEVTLMLAGNDLTGSYSGADHYAMFTIPESASLVVEGNGGSIKADTGAAENNRSLAIFQNSGKLTINGGTYELEDSTTDKTWIIATIVDNRTKSKSSETVLTINGGDYSVSGKAINLFRNYPQQGGTATLIINDGTFHDKDGAITYFWNQEAGSYVGEMYFNGGTYDAGVVYEDYNGQSDIHIADGVTIKGYEGNN